MSRTIVREARDEEHEACRRIVPECFFPGAAPELFVAMDGAVIQGVAAALWSAGGFPVQLRVLEPCRRRGIGRMLIDAVGEAARGETSLLRSWQPVAENGVGAKFLHQTGFTVERRLHGFETDGVGMIEEAQRFRNRLDRSGRIPRDARIVTLEEAPVRQVAQLIMQEFPAAPACVAARLRTGAGHDPIGCIVAMHGDRVVGAMLSTRKGSCLDIDANVVAPDHRRGWTNFLLLTSVLQRGVAAGVNRFRFFCDEDNRDTLNIGRRSRARALERALLFTKALPV